MKMPAISFLEWQQRFGDEESCVQALTKIRWPDGFMCPHCATTKAYYIQARKVYQCSQCRHQVSVTSDTMFHSTNLPLVKWFWAIYLAASDKRGISALRLCKLLNVSWLTARSILRKIRVAMGHRDSLCRLENIIEFDDTVIGGKQTGKRGRGATGKKPILVAVETHGDCAGFVAMKVVDSVSKETVREFLRYHIKEGQSVKTDALPALNAVQETQHHEKRVTPPEDVSSWLPMVHLMITNMKTFVNGTFHGVSFKFLQEYLDEFCYRFNRRFWEAELPLRLLNACLTHVPVRLAENC